MDLAIQIISNDKTIGNNKKLDFKEFINQSLTTQTKKGEKLVTMMPAIKKALSLLGNDTIELSTSNDALKNKIGSHDQQWLEESKPKLLKQINDDKRAILIMSRVKSKWKDIK